MNQTLIVYESDDSVQLVKKFIFKDILRERNGHIEN